MSFKPLPVFSHGHLQLHCTYGQELKNGSVINNINNYNDLAVRPAGQRGYFKPSFCHWPTGGYTRKEVQHNHRQGEYDVGPQSYEFKQYYKTEDIGVGKRGRQSDLAIMGSKSAQLTEAALKEWLETTTTGKRTHATRPDLNANRNFMTQSARPRPQSAPSVRSEDEKTNSTLALWIFSLTKGTAFEPQPKAAPWSTPSFAQYPPRPQSAGPAIARARHARPWGSPLTSGKRNGSARTKSSRTSTRLSSEARVRRCRVWRSALQTRGLSWRTGSRSAPWWDGRGHRRRTPPRALSPPRPTAGQRAPLRGDLPTTQYGSRLRNTQLFSFSMCATAWPRAPERSSHFLPAGRRARS